MITVEQVRAELRRAIEYGEGLRNISPEHDRALACARRTLELVDEYETLVHRLLDIRVPDASAGSIYDFIDGGDAIDAITDLQKDYRWKP